MSALGQKTSCPLYPRKRTLIGGSGMSALCQKLLWQRTGLKIAALLHPHWVVSGHSPHY